jgi:hypothetical protein
MALAACFPVFAKTFVYTDAEVKLQVVVDNEKRCSDPIVLQLLGASDVPKDWAWAAAIVRFEGRDIPACAAVVGDQVVVVDAEGSAGSVPVALFSRALDT